MAEQFEMKLVEEARYCTPRPEYREEILVMDDEVQGNGGVIHGE